MKFAIVGCNTEAALSLPHHSEVITTPYGVVKVQHITTAGGKEAILLTRHSLSLTEDAFETNYRANIYALYMCGVTHIISISLAGSCEYTIKPGSFCLTSDFIDFTRLRENTFRREHRLVTHVGMDNDFDEELNDHLESIIKQRNLPYGGRCIYACTDGPRYETGAEVRMFRELGAQLMGVTLVPEAPLAREMEMNYVSINIVARYGTGMDKYTTDEDILRLSDEHKGVALSMALEAIDTFEERDKE